MTEAKGQYYLPWRIVEGNDPDAEIAKLIGISTYIGIKNSIGDFVARDFNALGSAAREMSVRDFFFAVLSVNSHATLLKSLEEAKALIGEILDDYDALPPDRSLNWHEWADRARAFQKDQK